MEKKTTEGAAKVSTREIAEKLGADPRTVRRFLRSHDKGVGRGKRYEFTRGQLTTLQKQFAAWSKSNADTPAKESAAS